MNLEQSRRVPCHTAVGGCQSHVSLLYSYSTTACLPRTSTTHQRTFSLLSLVPQTAKHYPAYPTSTSLVTAKMYPGRTCICLQYIPGTVILPQSRHSTWHFFGCLRTFPQNHRMLSDTARTSFGFFDAWKLCQDQEKSFLVVRALFIVKHIFFYFFIYFFIYFFHDYSSTNLSVVVFFIS